jgi:hypothetical protein
VRSTQKHQYNPRTIAPVQGLAGQSRSSETEILRHSKKILVTFLFSFTPPFFRRARCATMNAVYPRGVSREINSWPWQNGAHILISSCAPSPAFASHCTGPCMPDSMLGIALGGSLCPESPVLQSIVKPTRPDPVSLSLRGRKSTGFPKLIRLNIPLSRMHGLLPSRESSI